MHLYLSARRHLNSSYTDEEGVVLYKVDTPFSLGPRTSNISCVLPKDIPKNGDTSASTDDRFGHLAQIVHNPFSSSILRFGGDEHRACDYFRTEGKRVRIFVSPDGREYKWLLQRLTSKLVLNDEAATPVAEFHRMSLGIFGKARPASLEIFPAGEHIIQEILITFVYIERLRLEKETTGL